MNDPETDPRFHLTPEEEKLWRQLKSEPNTKEDWADLLELIVTYKRRYIERHKK